MKKLILAAAAMLVATLLSGTAFAIPSTGANGVHAPTGIVQVHYASCRHRHCHHTGCGTCGCGGCLYTYTTRYTTCGTCGGGACWGGCGYGCGRCGGGCAYYGGCGFSGVCGYGSCGGYYGGGWSLFGWLF